MKGKIVICAGLCAVALFCLLCLPQFSLIKSKYNDSSSRCLGSDYMTVRRKLFPILQWRCLVVEAWLVVVACASAGRVTFNSRMTPSSFYGNGSCGNKACYYLGSLIHAMWAKIKTLIFHRYNTIYKSYHKTSIFPVALKTGMPSSLPLHPPTCCLSSCKKQGHPHKVGRNLAWHPCSSKGHVGCMKMQSAVRAPSPL